MLRTSSYLLALACAFPSFTLTAGCGGNVVVGNSASGGSGGGGGSTSAPDISGTYAVTHLTRSSLGTNCQVEGDPATGSLHFPDFRIQAESDGSYSFAECDSSDPSSCKATFAGFPWNVMRYAATADGGYQGAHPDALATDLSTCSLSFAEGLVTLGGEADVRIDARVYSLPNTTNPCTAEEAASLGKQMPCTEYDVVAGNKGP